MKAVTAKQIQKLDRIAIKKVGIPSVVLMENAGRSVAQEVLKSLKAKKNPRACIFCGLGNNGGDGFVVARHLWEQGVRIKVYSFADPRSLNADPRINFQILKKLKIPVVRIRKVDRSLIQQIQKSDAVVDAIFGVGLNRDVKGLLREAIELINTHARRIIAVDVPSGLNATTGKIHGICIKASQTVTFSFFKKGFRVQHGPQQCGKVKVIDIGIPSSLVSRI